ncbi:ubiquitin-like protein Pup [Bifidobacterium sp. DSM 109958]|uniref:Prokaryotic ubiquitin-like protein Pup n=1 Tax=Bifidobacterium moraviense TaxID=2675323 RepID=A0A7Y0HYN6_9BIFI|nr:ubiquitin-like protein Pup [Bifidobacterium sp. DSM 109958]NMM99948.1 ubiquitin-like protein Pup [Bifidobacterium sp. DSM 109958]
MPQEQDRITSQTGPEEESQGLGRVDADVTGQMDDLDAVLDDIESTLETNAEEYVNRFVQKGGE